MPKYLIRRDVPGVGELSADQFRELSAKSNDALARVGPGIRWVHSYVSEDRIMCVYDAESPALIREHARVGGFPCDEITQVAAIIDPVTAEG